MSEVDEVRAAADIVRILGDYVKLRKAGVNLMGLCPFHQEKTPSFAVHPTKQIFHCFGCGVGGDVFRFVMLREGVTFIEAVRVLAQRAGVELKEEKFAGEAEAGASRKDQLYRLHEDVCAIYQKILASDPRGETARAYLKKRKVAA